MFNTACSLQSLLDEVEGGGDGPAVAVSRRSLPGQEERSLAHPPPPKRERMGVLLDTHTTAKSWVSEGTADALVRNPSCLIHTATYDVTSGPP